MSSRKEAAQLIAVLERQPQLAIEHLRTGRVRVTGPHGTQVVIPGPNKRTNRRALDNARSKLRQIGADV